MKDCRSTTLFPEKQDATTAAAVVQGLRVSDVQREPSDGHRLTIVIENGCGHWRLAAQHSPASFDEHESTHRSL